MVVADRTVQRQAGSLLDQPIRPLLVPMWWGAEVFGAHLGPEVIDSGLRARWSEQERDYPDLRERLLPAVSIPVAVRNDALSRTNRKSSEFKAEIVAACDHLGAEVAKAIAADELALILGGDHSVAWGSVFGAAQAAENLGVIWIDAHADINTPQTSRSGHYHGMILAFLLGLCESDGSLGRLAPCLKPENLCYLGLRDIDPLERRVIADLGIWMQTMEEWYEIGFDRGLDDAVEHLGANKVDAVHVSFDLDVLDPTIMPGTGTRVDGGLDFPQALGVLRQLRNSGVPIRSVDFVELNPLLDQSGGSARVAVGLLAAFLGESMRSYS